MSTTTESDAIQIGYVDHITGESEYDSVVETKQPCVSVSSLSSSAFQAKSIHCYQVCVPCVSSVTDPTTNKPYRGNNSIVLAFDDKPPAVTEIHNRCLNPCSINNTNYRQLPL